MMDVFKFTLEWSQLDNIPEDERVLALMIGKLLNDINGLSKLLLWTRVDEKEIPLERHGRAAQAFLMMTTLAGKLIEGWELLTSQYFGAKVATTYHPLLKDDEGKKAIADLKAYFSGGNALRTARRQHAFHYDTAIVKEDYADLPREEPCEFFLATSVGFNLFQMSEAVASGALLRKIGSGNAAAGMNVLLSDSLRVSGLFQIFIGDFLMAFFLRHCPEGVPTTKIEIGTRPALDSISIPFLADLSE